MYTEIFKLDITCTALFQIHLYTPVHVHISVKMLNCHLSSTFLQRCTMLCLSSYQFLSIFKRTDSFVSATRYVFFALS